MIDSETPERAAISRWDRPDSLIWARIWSEMVSMIDPKMTAAGNAPGAFRRSALLRPRKPTSTQPERYSPVPLLSGSGGDRTRLTEEI